MTHERLTRKPEDIEDIYNTLDYFTDTLLNTLCDLESGNWGCPVNGTEELRSILREIIDPMMIALPKISELENYLRSEVDMFHRKEP